ncbi:DUF6909 family protein [Wenyingzhuangia sp. 2_MG-2023]|uniref:DUF6909 family protein n=1 Tax=Wenyingzhuangia sp. 2_MG-2023 TaxID=3062639 RepID=UPI0026E1FB0B|nr:hypothetical protein [Wenyingzhuangia sp. 2_MG-2023]MDO6736562.1 hypothetical protein [Wenyingzhuangia sp. 2_MG-2023]
MERQERILAQKSKRAIETMYITMLHLFNRGDYKPMGSTGLSLRNALLELQPEIYGSIADPKKFELQGLLYVLDRLPEGIETCRFINLTATEGLSETSFKKIVPPKRRRNCYRIDNEQMNIEITRGRSDIYDVLTHLTFIYLESHKLLNRMFVGYKNEISHEWDKLEELVLSEQEISSENRELLFVYLSNLLGRSFDELNRAYVQLATNQDPDRFFHIIYWLGNLAAKEKLNNEFRLIRFSDMLADQVGKHVYGNIWAKTIKKVLNDQNMLDRPIHIISSNMHSVLNVLYAKDALNYQDKDVFSLYEKLSDSNMQQERSKVLAYALEKGLIEVDDTSGANIDVQIIDTSFITQEEKATAPVLVVMDYAFGEQAFETMDELLKPYNYGKENSRKLDVRSISIMGKAGILCGQKGDIMIPTAHILEGTADNYFFINELSENDFKELNLSTFTGNMITVLGTSLQNKFILNYFKNTTWNSVGLEMEGAHYQKAIQIASQIRNHISKDVKVRYAYYASDNPLHSGSTLASGGLGMKGVVPTYAITEAIIGQIFNR